MIPRILFMKKYLVAGVFSFGLLLMSTSSFAANLDQLVLEALAKNPDLAAAKARWEQSSYKGSQVGSLKDPVLSFAFSSYPNDTLKSDATPMTGNEVKLAQAFPFPGKLDNRASAANEQARWFESVYLDNHYQIARKVKDTWYRLYFKERALAVTERNLLLVDDIIRLTEVRYETGDGLQQDVLKAQVQRSRIMEKLLSLQQQRTMVVSDLNSLLNRPVDADFDLPAELALVPVDVNIEEFQRAGKKNRPMSAAYRALNGRYRHQQELARLSDYPDVTLWTSWRFRDDNLADGGTDFVSAGVSFNLPVYRDKRRAEKAEANAGLRMAERQEESFHSGLSSSIQKAYARMQETRQQAELYKEGIIPQTSQSFQAAIGAYQVGKIAFISLLDALMTTYQAELEYYRVSSEYMRSLAQLEAESTLPLIGAPLTLTKQPANEFVE